MNPQEIKKMVDDAVALIQSDMQKQIDALQRQIDQFDAASDFDPAKKRTLELLFSGPSDKGATSENVSINEAGAAVKTVLGPPDRWGKLGTGNVPVYD